MYKTVYELTESEIRNFDITQIPKNDLLKFKHIFLPILKTKRNIIMKWGKDGINKPKWLVPFKTYEREEYVKNEVYKWK